MEGWGLKRWDKTEASLRKKIQALRGFSAKAEQALPVAIPGKWLTGYSFNVTRSYKFVGIATAGKNRLRNDGSF